MRLVKEAGEPMSPIKVSKRLGIGLSKASYHFSRMEQAEALELVGSRPVRGSVEHFYLPGDLVDRNELFADLLLETD